MREFLSGRALRALRRKLGSERRAARTCDAQPYACVDASAARKFAMSLSFLSKKSWHTTNLQNVEKVWLAEQAEKKEAEKLDQWKKEREEERQIEQLRRCEYIKETEVKALCNKARPSSIYRITWCM